MKNIFLSTRTRLAALGVAVIGLAFSSCNKFNDDNDSPNTPVAGLMAFNLAPDKPGIGVALSGSALFNQPLAYTNYSGSYLGIYVGNRAVEAYDYGSSSPFASTQQEFLKDKYYSAFVVGADSNYRAVVVQDAFDSLSGASGQAYIRYINAIPDSSSPAVTIVAGGTNVVNEKAAYASVSEFAAITPGPVSISVNNGSTINTSRDISVEARKIYTVLLMGIPGSADEGDSLQIKYVNNGTLSEENVQRSSAVRSERVN